VIAIAAAIVSCKKETDNTISQRANNIQAFDFRQIEDMNAYLKDFKEKMAESKSDESYNLNDAAWHLASLANRDFCRIDGEYDDVQFDTIEMQVRVTDGAVLLGDINAAYEQMCNAIRLFEEGFSHNNQKLHFINMLINADGNAKIVLMTTFSSDSKHWYDYQWYFDDGFEAADVCDYYFGFNSNTQYPWNGYGKTELQRILNIFEHHDTILWYYTPTQRAVFDYNNSDPYTSPYLYNSRVFANSGPSTYTHDMSADEMCYCLDSYLGLGYDYLAANSIYPKERPACWIVNDTVVHFPSRLNIHYHELTVQYARMNADPYNPDPGAN
jgi:hypothetical protein